MGESLSPIQTSLRILQILAAGAILGSVHATVQENIAARKRDYEANCASCHGESLDVIPVNSPGLT